MESEYVEVRNEAGKEACNIDSERKSAYSREQVRDVVAFIEAMMPCKFCKQKTLKVVKYQTGQLRCEGCGKEYGM